ncbi:dTDP-4-dehydrorhamnose 3,5-epimerase [Fervidobacterium riparium]|nr:dTDP-4-dehydrorhamnose 3,5-epimerase [Fervidobacterium riparium]
MKLIETELPGVYIIEPKVFGDERGWFMETYSRKVFKELGIDVEFVQDNHSYSKHKYTLRGIHFQNNPMAQSKLVRCTRGKILDIAVDLRRGSPTYKKWIAIELSADDKKMLFIPKGFGHAFLTLTDDVEVQYKVGEYYSKEHDRSIRWDDPELNIDWPTKEPILSEKDRNAPYLKDSDCNFVYEGDNR